MRCFTTSGSKIFSGIKVEADERLGKVVKLGEEGRGRLLTKVKLDGRTPPPVDGDLVREADVVEFEVGGVKRHALTASRPGDERLLVRVMAGRGYTRRGNGYALGYWGSPVVVEQGHGADGDAGRIGTWQDYLMVVQPVEAVFVQPSGGVDGYVLHYPAAGTEPRIWNVEEFRTEVVAPWAEGANLEEVEAALAQAVERRSEKLAAILRAKLAERAEASGATESVRRNVRWDAGRQAVVVDQVTVFRGTEVKTSVVLADAADPAEAAESARVLRQNMPELTALVKRLQSAVDGLAAAAGCTLGAIVDCGEIWQSIEQAVLGCVTREEALRRDLSGITLDRFVPVDRQQAIRATRPAAIEVLGRQLPVEYSYGRPSVKFAFTDLAAEAWQAASGSLALPDGTPVSVTVKGTGWEAVAPQGDLGALPVKIREAAAVAALHMWQPPAVPEPVELLDGDTPQNLEAVYGRDILTGEPLTAYGRWTFSSYYGSWEVSFGPQPVEAKPLDERTLAQVRERLRERHAERAAELARQAVQAAYAAAVEGAEQARSRLSSSVHGSDWYELPEELRRRVDAWHTDYFGSTAAEVQAWTADTEALAAELTAAYAHAAAAKADAERREREPREAADNADRTRLGALLAHDWVRGDLDLARRVDAFVLRAISAVGGRNAVTVLAREARQDYGRGARTVALEQVLGEAVRTGGLDWAAGRDIEPAAFWAGVLDQSSRSAASGNGRSDLPASSSGGQTLTAGSAGPAAAGRATFADIGGRWFRCSCGCITRVEKATWRQYEQDEAILVVCSVCRQSGRVKK